MNLPEQNPAAVLQQLPAALLCPNLEGGSNAGWVPLSFAVLWCSPTGHMQLLPVSHYAGAPEQQSDVNSLGM